MASDGCACADPCVCVPGESGTTGVLGRGPSPSARIEPLAGISAPTAVPPAVAPTPAPQRIPSPRGALRSARAVPAAPGRIEPARVKPPRPARKQRPVATGPVDWNTPWRVGRTAVPEAERARVAVQLAAARAERQAARAKGAAQRVTKQAATTWSVGRIPVAKSPSGPASGPIAPSSSAAGGVMDAAKAADALHPGPGPGDVTTSLGKDWRSHPSAWRADRDTPVITRCGTLTGEYTEVCHTGASEVIVIGSSAFQVGDSLLLDATMAAFLVENDIPNASVAVVASDGRLVYIRGFTNCDAYAAAKENVFFAGPDSKFRLCSVSKLFTGIATLKLVELGLLPDSVGGLVGDFVDLASIPEPCEGVSGYEVDPWLAQVTISNCLTHTGGWVRDVAPDGDRLFVDGIYPPWPWVYSEGVSIADPLRELTECANLNFATLPTAPLHMQRYGNLAEMAFEPGWYYCYSNYGWWLLGQVIQGATCRSYESVIQEYIFKPIGMRSTFAGDAALGLRMVGEVPYFEEHWPASSEDWSASVTESQWYQTTFRRTFTHQDAVDGYKPYAHSDLRMGLACGGWVSSAYDIALFLRDLFVGPSVVLSEDTITHMALQHATYTASGYDRGQTLSGLDWSSSDGFAKNGHMPGSHAYVRHLASPRTQDSPHTGDGGLGGLGDADDGSAAGASVVFLFNRYFDDDLGTPPLRSRFHDIEATIVDLLKDITNWGSDDAFES